MMALNRYPLKRPAGEKRRSAILTTALLKHPEHLPGLILLANHVVYFYAALLGAFIAVRLIGDPGYVLGPFILAFIFLVFAEVTPKTLAVSRPERIASLAAYILKPLSIVCYPLTWLANNMANGLLLALGIKPEAQDDAALLRDKLRAGQRAPDQHQDWLLSIFELESTTVEEVMVPRADITGIDISEDLNETMHAITQSSHTRLPLYNETLDAIIGVIHARRLPRILKGHDELSRSALKDIALEPYFVPLGTPLHRQLLNFQRLKKRLAFVVDEYGVIQGLITLEDILEEIVGEFTTDVQTYHVDILAQEDGTYLIDGSATIRDINRRLHWALPSGGAKTLNGLILERLEAIPEPGTSLRIDNLTMEIRQVIDNAVKSVQVKVLESRE